jgi:LmbE family N-acetylglucosaminyl deacetylase
MLDHDQTSVLVRNACFQAPAPNYDCTQHGAAAALPSIPHLYYWDVMEGIDIFGKPVAPAFYVDISGEMDLKLEMLGAHRSQREWLRAQHHMDEYVETVRAWGARRGREATEITGARADITYAEVFRQHLGHAYPHDNVLAALFPSRVVPNPVY